MASGLVVLLLVALAMPMPRARAQTLEPRSYSNAPVGLNFRIAGYGYTSGNVAFDPAVPLTDAHLTTNTAVLAFCARVRRLVEIRQVRHRRADRVHGGRRGIQWRARHAQHHRYGGSAIQDRNELPWRAGPGRRSNSGATGRT